MPPQEYAQILIRKAAQDEFVLSKLISDPESPDEVIGFHAQQAVEKLLKAVLSSRSVTYRRTHDLVELMDLLKAEHVSFPVELEEVRRLGPFAVEFRYGDVPEESPQPLDRPWAASCVTKVKTWALSVIR
jgi:HEPN domain-containing protein